MSWVQAGTRRRIGQTAHRQKLLLVIAALLPILLLDACAGLVGKPGQGGSGSFSVSPNKLSFGKVATGQKMSQTMTLTNNGSVTVTIQQITTSAPQFGISGITLPLTMQAGAVTTFSVWVNGTSTGKLSGTLTIQGDSGATPVVANLDGTITTAQPQISLTPGTVDLGTVSIGSKGTSTLSVGNTGASDLTISMITVNGAEFGISGITTPKTISAGQTVPVTVGFNPTTAGTAQGSIVLTSNDPNNPTSTVSLAGTGSSSPVGKLVANPSSLTFLSVAVGTNSSQSFTLTNSGTASVTISNIAAAGPGFSVSGVSLPVTLGPSENAILSAKFTPRAAGAANGSITVTSNAPGSPLTISLGGTGALSGLSVSPPSFNFGSVVDGQTKSQNFTLTNTGNATLTVTQISVAGAGYSASGLNTPTAIAAGKTATFSMLFAPSSAGSLSGSVSIASDAPGSPSVAALSGTGVAASVTISPSPGSINFGSVNAGNSSSKTVTFTNGGNSTVTISQVAVNAKDVTASGIATPMTLTPGQKASLDLTFNPSAAENVTGNVTVTSSQGSSAVIPVSGSGVQAGLALTPSIVSFGNVTIGSPNSQTVQIANTGNAVLTISQLSVTGSGFSTSSVSLPLSINPGATSTFNVQFAPQSAGIVLGSVSLLSNAPNSPSALALSGTGVAASTTISLSTSSLSFGNVNTGSTAQQSLTITDTGNSNVTISQIVASGAGYSLIGAGTPVTLTPTQSLTFTVQFSPAAAGAANGSVSVVSNAAGSPATVSLTGTGVATTPHSVALSWNASTSTVSGYNVYRSTTSGSGYTKVNSSLVGGLSYTDSGVQNSQTYYYVTTAVDASGNESSYSNEAQAIVP